MNARQRGFNLIEAAIVLGVIGLVIGGIWVAASSIREATFTNEVTKLVLGIRQYSDENKATLVDYRTTNVIVSLYPVISGPEGFRGVKSAYCTTSIYNGIISCGKSAWIQAIGVEMWGGGPPLLDVTIWGMSVAECTKVLVRITASDKNMYRVNGDASLNGGVFPFPLDIANAACIASAGSLALVMKL